MTYKQILIGAASAMALTLAGCETIENAATAVDNEVNKPAPAAVVAEPDAPAVPTVSEAPEAPTEPVINGENVKEAVFTNGVRLSETAPGLWTEYSNSDGKAAFTFTETHRDEWSVYLKQVDSGKRLQIDIHRKKLIYSEGDTQNMDLYDLASWSDVATPPPAKYTSEGVNGPNLKKVAFADKKAAFEETGPGIWTEYNEDGQAFNTFTETHRDDWSVYLKDEGRNIRIQLDVHRKMIGLAQNGGAMADQWPMTSMWTLND